MIASISVPLRAFLTPSMPSFTLATVLASALSPKSLITFSAMEELQKPLYELSAAAYQQAQQAQQQAGGAGANAQQQTQTKDDDNVVDADFKDVTDK